MNGLIRAWHRGRTPLHDSDVRVRQGPSQSPEDASDTVRSEKKPSPNFVTNFLIPAWNIAFGHDELRERYLNLRSKRQHD